MEHNRLVVEIHSPDDPDRALFNRRFDYALAEIPEYGFVNPRDERMHVLTLKNGNFEPLVSRAILVSRVLPDLKSMSSMFHAKLPHSKTQSSYSLVVRQVSIRQPFAQPYCARSFDDQLFSLRRKVEQLDVNQVGIANCSLRDF